MPWLKLLTGIEVSRAFQLVVSELKWRNNYGTFVFFIVTVPTFG